MKSVSYGNHKGSRTHLRSKKLFIINRLWRGGARSPERTVLGMADFPDNREFTGKIVKIGLQAANSPYNNRIFSYG